MSKCGIYGFFQISSGKWYVGQSIDIERREKEHRTCIDSDWHQLLLKNPNDFIFTILEECKEEELDSREAYYINLYNSFESGFNSTRGNTMKHEKVNTENIDFSDFHIMFDDGEDEAETKKILKAIRAKTFVETLSKILDIEDYKIASPKYWLRKKFRDNCYLIQVTYSKNNSSERDYIFIYLNLEKYIDRARDAELENVIKRDKIWWEDKINSSKVFDMWFYISRIGGRYTCNKTFQVSEHFLASCININSIEQLLSLNSLHEQAQLQRIDCCPYFMN